MKTIKFRGKDANGEWKEGSLITDKYQRSDGKQFDVSFIVSGLPCVELPDDIWTSKMQRVDPTTVGQFTGLHDKNGKEIYEGDIIQGEYNHNHLIRYSEYDACYTATLVEYVGDEFAERWNTGSVTQKWIDEFSKVVIGNIFDNPKLIKCTK